MTVYYGDIYSNPPKSAVPGARYDYRLYPIAAALLSTSHIFCLGVVPARHRLLDCQLEVGPLDTGANITINVGLANWYFNRAEASATAPGWNQYNGTPGIPAQVGSATGATTPAENDGYGGTSVALATGFLIISATTIGRSSAGGRAGITASLTPTVTFGVSNYDRIIALQLGVNPSVAVAANIGLYTLIDAA